MKLDTSNLKKRKLLAAAAEDLGLPAPKHVCCEVADRSEGDSLVLRSLDEEDVEVLDILVESTEDSNSFPGDSQSSTEVIFDATFRKMDSYDEASTSWANSKPVTSGDSLSLESKILSVEWDGMEENQLPHQDKTGWHDMEENQLPHQDKTGWHDMDCLDECIGAPYCKDSKQQVTEQLEGLLSSSGILSSERLTVDREAQMGRHKPTIDQEFEQYFSTLML